MKIGIYKGNGGYTYTVLEGGDEPLIVVRGPDGKVTRAKEGGAKTAIVKELESKEPDEPLHEDQPAQPAAKTPEAAPEKGMLEKGKDYISKAISDKMAEMKGLGRVPDEKSWMGTATGAREVYDNMDPENRGHFEAAVKAQFGDKVKLPEKEEEEEKPAEAKGTKPSVSVDGGSFRAGVDVDGDKKADLIPVARTGR